MSDTPIYEDQMDALREFHEAFDPPQDVAFWIGLVNEEVGELEEALENVLKELCDVLYVSLGTALVFDKTGKDRRELGAQVDRQFPGLSNRLGSLSALADEIFPYKIIQQAFARVHASNMSKLDPETGQPIRRREDGKIMKGPNYKPPVLSDLIKHMENTND